MRPRNATLRRRLLVGLAAAALGAAAPACGGESPERAAAEGSSRAAADVDPGPILEEPTVDGLLALLAQDHRAARRALGRHRLSYSADFSLLPPELPRPQPGDHPPVAREIHDALTLVWAGDDDREPALHLRQGPDEEASRELVILGEEAYSRLPYRGWLHRPIDSELHWAWLDDAERAVHDMVALVGSDLAIAIVESGDDSATLALSKADARTPRATTAEHDAWREKAVFTAVDGRLVLDREHGLWLRAELRATYTLTDEEGRTLTGEASLTAEREVDASLAVQPPAASAPFPERIRYDVERRRLLDGLAR